LRRIVGTNGLRFPVELSQIKISPESKVMFTIDSEDNFFIASTEEQDFCKDNNSKKLKPGIVKS
jgi:hypothetical protein